MLVLLALMIDGAACNTFIPASVNKFQANAQVPLFVNKLDSEKTQLPFGYYYLNYCSPDHREVAPETLEQILRGDRVESSQYEIYMGITEWCKVTCPPMRHGEEQLDNFRWMIDNDYKVQWMIDSLPSGYRQTLNHIGRLSMYQDSFPIGYKQGGQYFIYNHANIVLQTSTDDDGMSKIVGFLVEPLSLRHSYTPGPGSDDGMWNLACKLPNFAPFFGETNRLPEKNVKREQIPDEDLFSGRFQHEPQLLSNSFVFTYSVIFEESNTQWASRWDHYLYMETDNSEVHWLSIINSFAMILFLSAMVMHILRKTVMRQAETYNEQAQLEPVEESGWKQIIGHVFRPPAYPGIFSIIIGSGIQVLSMSILTVVFTIIGFLTPSYRGRVLTTMLLLYVFMGVFAGYYSARVYKMFGGEKWQRNTMGTALLFPGTAFGIFFIIDMTFLAEESSGAVPLSTLASILLMWLGVSVPLVFLGSALGFRAETLSLPVKPAKITRPLPPGSWKLTLICILSGSLPFGCMFIELSFLMNSIWHHSMFYYLFGFLILTLIVLVLTSALVSVLMCYIMLNREDYRWWWYSVGVSGSSGVYLFLYSIIYALTQLSMTRLSSYILFFGYMALLSTCFALTTAVVGFLATFAFVKQIYGMIKLD